MGEAGFSRAARELFNFESLDYDSFLETVRRHLPDRERDVRFWLETTEYPPRFHRP
jgi:hypothetical protein